MKKSIQTPLGVYTDDEVGIEMIESFANQRVIEELEKASLMDVEKLKEVHEAIRNVLIDYECEEYGDCIIDEISKAVGIPPTTIYYEE